MKNVADENRPDEGLIFLRFCNYCAFEAIVGSSYISFYCPISYYECFIKYLCVHLFVDLRPSQYYSDHFEPVS